jgi:hypothetical protein
MIYSVHFYYRKLLSNKAACKFEGIVFAKNKTHAEELIRKLISGFQIEVNDGIHIIGNESKTLDEIYKERPELMRVSPEQGFIYNEFSHKNAIRRYLK